MGAERRTGGEVLRDKRGIATSIPEVLGGISLKVITIAAVGAVLAIVLVFWAVATASADSSSGFQNANVGFEKAVRASDVVVGIDTNRVGLLKDVAGNKCEVQTWQNGMRDGKTTLQVDTTTVAGVCTPTTPFLVAGSSANPREMLFEIDTPVFTFSNLGGRELTFSSSGIPTLTTGSKPAGVKLADWNDVRPYKTTLKVQALDKNTTTVTKSAVLSAFTNVVNVTAATDDLRYVPSPSSDPIPGPVRITGVERSTTTGDPYAGAREGIAVTFAGAVCPAGPTKVNVSYTQQGPSAAPPVNSVSNAVLTGADMTIHLGSVPNGSSGAVEVSATCVDGGVVEKASLGYTQQVPRTVLTVNQNAASEKHDLSWTAVSSLPTSFELRWTVGTKNDELLTTTSALVYQSVNTAGANLGLTTTYTIVGTVDSNKSPTATSNITNPLPQAPATVVRSNANGATWDAITCTEGATPQYASRYYQQTGTDAAVNWTAMSDWSTNLSLTGVVTPGYGRTVGQVHTRCVATVSGVISPTNNNYDQFYAPEAIQVSAARSTTAGTVYMGAREGIVAWQAGARCYNGSTSRIDLTWQPGTPAGQTNVTSSRVFVPTGGSQSIDIANVFNGATGNLVGTATCTAGKSSSSTKSAAYSQALPNPGLTVAQTTAEAHRLDWNKVSTLPTTFNIEWGSTNGTRGSAGSTTALTFTKTHPAGTTYGMTSDYTVRPVVGDLTSSSYASTATSWPASPTATGISYTGTGVGAKITDGVIAWSHTGTCPAGTDILSQEIQNVKWDGSTGQSSTANYTVGTWGAKTSAAWNPTYAMEGYPYQEAVNTQCRSAITGSTSAASTAQSGTFYTRMNTPSAPSYNGFDFQDWVRGDSIGFGTCWVAWGAGANPCSRWSGWNVPVLSGGKGHNSYQMDYNYSCPAGSTLGYSYYRVDNLTMGGGNDKGVFGKQDGWQLAGRQIDYQNSRPQYQCKTLWMNSATSPVGATVVEQIKVRW